MIVKSLKLNQFRNYESLQLSFDKGTQSIYLLSVLHYFTMTLLVFLLPSASAQVPLAFNTKSPLPVAASYTVSVSYTHLNNLDRLPSTSQSLPSVQDVADRVNAIIDAVPNMFLMLFIFLSLEYSHVIHFHLNWEGAFVNTLHAAPITAPSQVEDNIEWFIERP